MKGHLDATRFLVSHVGTIEDTAFWELIFSAFMPFTIELWISIIVFGAFDATAGCCISCVLFRHVPCRDRIWNRDPMR